jgi:hypothetical protein
MISIFLEPLFIKHIGKDIAETKRCFLLFEMDHAGEAPESAEVCARRDFPTSARRRTGPAAALDLGLEFEA